MQWFEPSLDKMGPIQVQHPSALNLLDFPRSRFAFFLNSAEGGWPSDEEFRQAWLHYNVYSVPQRCKLILDALEKSSGHKEPAVLDAATIEHVMPQTLTEEWRNMLAADGNPDKIHDLLVHTIGNLTLTAYNPELSNLGFQEKKKIYASSHYSLNEWFTACPVWNTKQIEERAMELWEQAKEIWPAPFRCRCHCDGWVSRNWRGWILCS